MARVSPKSKAAGVLALVLGAASPASANVYEAFGAGARAISLAGNATATTGDAAAVWHNPAGLSLAPNSVALGLSGSFDRTSILLAPRPRGYDPPGYDLRLNERRDSGDQGRTLGVTLGGTIRLFSDNLRAGLLIYFPSVGFAHADGHLPDERQQYFENRLRFELLDERLKSEVIALGLSYRLAEWLSLGVGLKTLQVAENTTHVYTPNAVEPSKSYMVTQLEQTTETALVAGALVQPWPFLRLGLSFHDEIAFAVKGRSRIQIRGQEDEDEFPLTQPIRQVQHASVPRIAFGAAYTGDELTASVDASYVAWSRYIGPDGRRARFDDSYTVGSGVEYQLRPSTWLRGGLGWHPSPVPDQTGRTNYVDNDRIIVGLGAGNAFELWENAFRLDLGVQVQTLLARQTTKRLPGRPAACTTDTASLCDEVPDSAVDTPVLDAAETQGLQTGNPGFPGFSSGGYMLTAGVDVRWFF
ncbi:outer membrane protein transport protein [Myxococcota bacterium]|nr:outer membrane protein transport protein [Myxococcota bacterium]